MKTLEDLVRRLDRIAKENGDEFRYSFKVRALSGQGIVVDFEAAEAADGHVFVSGRGDTQTIPAEHSFSVASEEAIHEAWDGIEEACGQWGYKEVA